MDYQVMKISSAVIQERKRDITSQTFEDLSTTARSVSRLMMRIYNQKKKFKFLIDDIREHNSFGGWRNIEDAFFELESRGFGEVKQFKDKIYLQINIPALQSVR
jgi:hypothetical protein